MTTLSACLLLLLAAPRVEASPSFELFSLEGQWSDQEPSASEAVPPDPSFTQIPVIQMKSDSEDEKNNVYTMFVTYSGTKLVGMTMGSTRPPFDFYSVEVLKRWQPIVIKRKLFFTKKVVYLQVPEINDAAGTMRLCGLREFNLSGNDDYRLIETPLRNVDGRWDAHIQVDGKWSKTDFIMLHSRVVNGMEVGIGKLIAFLAGAKLVEAETSTFPLVREP